MSKTAAKRISAADFVPADHSLEAMRAAAAGCRGCELFATATQTVFGEGSVRSRAVLVGEQPGDQEDLTGRPFVGPAGKLLRESLEAAGIDPGDVYITNAVKHFKFVERGKRRIHATPKVTEIRACAPWLAAELEAIRPYLVVALGATAAQALLGAEFRVTKSRGQLVASPLAERVIATVHPSSILRADDATREAERRAFVEDLKIVAELLRDS
jgi:DNA polymerase